jgi:hypothetical protein
MLNVKRDRHSSLSLGELERMEEKFESLLKETRKLKVKSTIHITTPLSHFVQNVHIIEWCV